MARDKATGAWSDWEDCAGRMGITVLLHLTINLPGFGKRQYRRVHFFRFRLKLVKTNVHNDWLNQLTAQIKNSNDYDDNNNNYNNESNNK